jgi:hypothetical protein
MDVISPDTDLDAKPQKFVRPPRKNLILLPKQNHLRDISEIFQKNRPQWTVITRQFPGFEVSPGETPFKVLHDIEKLTADISSQR